MHVLLRVIEFNSKKYKHFIFSRDKVVNFFVISKETVCTDIPLA